MKKPVVGLQLYSLRAFEKTAADLAATMQKVRAMGYTTVQVSGFGPIDPKDVARIMADNGLTVAATHMGWKRFQTELDAVIEEHRLWGCKHPAIGSLPGEYFSLDGLKRFVDELGPIAARLKQAGMDFSYHNHNHEFATFEGRTWLRRLYDLAGPDLLKAELDVFWVTAGGGDPAQWIRDLGPRQPLLHLKDMCIVPPREQRFASVGGGNLNWPAILKAAGEVGVEYMLVEQDDTYGADPFEAVATSLRNLRAMGY